MTVQSRVDGTGTQNSLFVGGNDTGRNLNPVGATEGTSTFEYCHEHNHIKKSEVHSILNPVISSKLLIDNINREIFDNHLPKGVLEVLESGLLTIAGVNQ